MYKWIDFKMKILIICYGEWNEVASGKCFKLQFFLHYVKMTKDFSFAFSVFF